MGIREYIQGMNGYGRIVQKGKRGSRDKKKTKDNDGPHWVTIHGHHVFIDSEGDVEEDKGINRVKKLFRHNHEHPDKYDEDGVMYDL